MSASIETTSYCPPCDRVIVWKSWRVWQHHIQSPEHRECLIAPRPLPPDRIRSADFEDSLLGLADGESAVFRRPDGRWIGLASLGAGASLRIEGSQKSIVVERLARHLGPDSQPAKALCLRCRLILDPVILSHHYTSAGHRAHKDPTLGAEEPSLSGLPSTPRQPPAEAASSTQTERFTVAMAPLMLDGTDAARILGLSKATAERLARDGTLPSLRLGRKALFPVKALEDWIEGRLAEDTERERAPWSRVRAYAWSRSAPTPSRSRYSSRWSSGKG